MDTSCAAKKAATYGHGEMDSEKCRCMPYAYANATLCSRDLRQARATSKFLCHRREHERERDAQPIAKLARRRAPAGPTQRCEDGHRKRDVVEKRLRLPDQEHSSGEGRVWNAVLVVL